MLEELESPSNLLHNAMDQYLSVCLSIKRCFPQNQGSTAIPGLFSRVDSESTLLPLLEGKLKEARIAINWTRNRSNTLTSINKLHPELLAHVFQLLLGWQARAQKTCGSLNKTSAKYPGALSHVCSHWRRVAISSCSLWTLYTFQQGLLDRAKTYAQRAGVLLLDVRLTDPPGPSGPRYGHAARLRSFFISYAHRIRSLEVILQKKTPRRIQDYKLSDFFERCIPGTFTEFVARRNPASYDNTGADWEEDEGDDSCIRASDGANHKAETDWFLTINEACLEQVFRSLTVLHLDRIHPLWPSKAYHGLVELRLTREESIREVDLVNMLSSSPELRILVLGIGINDAIPTGIPVTPITLQDLEILHAHRMEWGDIGSFFRWLVPGTKPLFLSVDGVSLDLSEPCIESFLERSNVAKLYASSVVQTDIVTLLRRCPHVEILVIEECALTDDTDEDLPIEHAALRALYMLQYKIDMDVLVELVRPNSVQTLAFHGCPFYLTSEQVKARLVTFCPDIRHMTNSRTRRHPIEERDIFTDFEY